MESSALLQQIVKNLEQHESALRIKKLIFAVCRNTWENDKNVLDSFDLAGLIHELINKNPTLEDLKASLSKFVKTLNKPQEYALVAKAIFSNVAKLYPETQRAIQVNSNSDNEPTITIPYTTKQVTNIKAEAKSTEIKRDFDPFDVRVELMNYTNPLRAKIVLFSVLYQTFEFTNQDWFNLRAHQLDDLIRRILRACKSLTELESQLRSTAKSLQEPDENTKAANAIIKCLQPFYAAAQLGGKQTKSFSDEDMITRVNGNENYQSSQTGGTYDDDNTCQFIPS